jgi:hypothetical protein
MAAVKAVSDASSASSRALLSRLMLLLKGWLSVDRAVVDSTVMLRKSGPRPLSNSALDRAVRYRTGRIAAVRMRIVGYAASKFRLHAAGGVRPNSGPGGYAAESPLGQRKFML